MFFNVALTVVLLFAGLSIAQPPPLDTGILSQAITLGECYVCKTYIESFKKGLERTAKGNYEGGDAAWEEEKLKTYTRSEMRLVDIQESLCKEVSKHAVQCHHMAEKAEEYIEEWWAQNPDESADLYTYICVEKMKVCCPKYHFGKYCTPCRGNPEMPCSGKGRCRGEGTRKGNGTCVCDEGYKGDLCDQCAPDYFLSHKHGSNIICSPCHQACLGGCREATQKDCVACKPGFTFDADEGCTDINECDDVNTCKKNEFCLNSLGSFMCMKCDKSCQSCHGDGPDMCRKCAIGYSKKGEFCIADREEEEDSAQKLTTTRKEEL